MKTHISKLTVLASLILSVASQAATPTTELKVKGKIGVPSCTVIAPNNGVYDMGRLSATNVKAGTTVTALPEMKKNWTITCDSTTYLSLSSVDNRLASVSDATSTRNYGLGNINRTGKIGFYTVILSNASVDGTSTSMYYRVGTGAATLGTSLYLVNGYTYGWSNSTSTANFGKTFSADIAVTPTLAGTSTMNGPITEDSNIDGSLTMNFSFGI